MKMNNDDDMTTTTTTTMMRMINSRDGIWLCYLLVSFMYVIRRLLTSSIPL